MEKRDKQIWYGGIGVIGIVALLLFWYSASIGLKWTDDSYNYVAASESFLADQTFLCADGTPFAFWPPLFPIVLAALHWLGIPLVVFHALLLIVITLQLALISQRFITSLYLRLLFVALCVWGVYIQMVAAFVWSELFFVFLLLLHYILFLQRKEMKLWWIGATLVAAALCLQRSAGVFYLSGIMLVWLWENKSDWKHWLQVSFSFLVSISGLMWWQLTKSAEQATGFNLYEHKFFVDFVHNVGVLLQGTARMFAPDVVPLIITALLLLVAVVFVALTSNRLVRELMIIMLMYYAGYSVMQWLNPEEVDRYLSVVAPMVLLLFFSGIDRVSTWWSRYRPIITIGLVLWMFYPLSRTVVNVKRWHSRPERQQQTGARPAENIEFHR